MTPKSPPKRQILHVVQVQEIPTIIRMVKNNYVSKMIIFCFESGEISVAFEPQKSPQNDLFYM